MLFLEGKGFIGLKIQILCPIPFRPDSNLGFLHRHPIGHILSYGGTGGLYLDINLEFLLRPPIVHVLTY